MSDCNKDSVFEEELRRAVIANIYDELDELPPDDELAREHPISNELEQRMERLFKGASKPSRRKKLAKWVKNTAAVIVLSISIFSMLLMLAPEMRACAAETVVKWFSGSETPEYPVWHLANIPDGFEETSRAEESATTVVTYENDRGQMLELLVLAPELADLLDDIYLYDIAPVVMDDGIRIMTSKVLDSQGKPVSNSGNSCILWQYDGIIFVLHSDNFSSEEVYSMAQVIKK